MTAKVGESGYPPLDGGWGYVICLACFSASFMLDGLENSYGLLMPSVLQTFQPNVALATLCGGMLTGVTLGMGPLTAVLVRKFGCRPVAFTGGIVTTISISIATRAQSIHVFILFYGFCAGIGLGLIYLPSITIINMYFNKKRGTVVGVVTSGSGVGLLVMAIVIDRLMAEYGWRGCYLIIAGLYLHLCVSACLMRPLEDNYIGKTNHASDPSDAETEERLLSEKYHSSHHSLTKEELNNEKSSMGQTKDIKHQESTIVRDSGGTLMPNSFKSCTEHNLSECNGKVPRSNGYVISDLKSPSDKYTPSDVVSRQRLCGCPDVDKDHIPAGNGAELYTEVTHSPDKDTPKLSPNSLGISNSSDLIHSSHHYNSHPSHHHSHHHFHPRRPHLHHGSASLHGSHHTVSAREDMTASTTSLGTAAAHKMALLNQPSELVSASTLSINTQRSMSQVSVRSRSLHSLNTQHGLSRLTLKSGSLTSVEEQEAEVEDEATYSSFALLKIIRFDLVCAGAFLIQIAASIPAMFTPSYVLSLGMDSTSAANIVSFLGISNTIGRLAAGLLANLGLGSVRVYNTGTFLAGVACYLLPLCDTFPTLIAFAVGHGFFIGFFPPLQSVILVEQLGIGRLPSSFGIMCVCKSLASMAGPSLAGALFEIFGNYAVPFYFAGGLLTLSTILHIIMSYCPKIQD